MSDIVINKIQSIQRCVERAHAEYRGNATGFDRDYTGQDAAMLNVLRASEQAIDLANHVIKTRKMGIPSSSIECFELLEKKLVIDKRLTDELKKIVHFRNVVIRAYQRVDINIVKSMIISGLDDLVLFGDRTEEYVSGPAS